ncbi:DUF535 family protein [Burkholderia sp. L27(2015)]|uniref:DUF535 family protein n=1 Tax=Burkholderia sp. L27(2015) TaxID=1641858 RepID=UPI00131B53CE|nr:DUF535 family protein [Burkholderia sp. L27(2015)]
MSEPPVPLLQEKPVSSVSRVWEKIRHVFLENNLSKLLLLILNIRSHWALSHAMTLAGLPKEAEFYKSMRFRYLRTYYLGGRFSIAARLAIATHHYITVAKNFKQEFLVASRGHGYKLWNKETEGEVFDIHLRFPYAYNYDGDLCLALGSQGEDAYIVTLSIAPGHIVNSAERRVLLISGIQGIAGKIDTIRKVTEVCNNVSPVHLLIMAAEALADTVGASAIVGIGNRQMPSDQGPKDDRHAFDYDAFWMPMVGKDAPEKTYHMHLPFMDKPIELIPAKHRSRARKRRELRNQIREDIHTQAFFGLRTNCLK